MKNITVNLKKEEDLYDKYSDNVSRDLLDYLINEARYTKGDIKITINTTLDIKNIESLIKDGLLKISNETRKLDMILDMKQVMFLMIGVIFLIISGFIFYNVIKEIIVIAGWVAIWEVVDISLNVDSKSRANIKLIKRLMNSKIEINKVVKWKS